MIPSKGGTPWCSIGSSIPAKQTPAVAPVDLAASGGRNLAAVSSLLRMGRRRVLVATRATRRGEFDGAPRTGARRRSSPPRRRGCWVRRRRRLCGVREKKGMESRVWLVRCVLVLGWFRPGEGRGVGWVLSLARGPIDPAECTKTREGSIDRVPLR
jgi:hypothetical protein